MIFYSAVYNIIREFSEETGELESIVSETSYLVSIPFILEEMFEEYGPITGYAMECVEDLEEGVYRVFLTGTMVYVEPFSGSNETAYEAEFDVDFEQVLKWGEEIDFPVYDNITYH